MSEKMEKAAAAANGVADLVVDAVMLAQENAEACIRRGDAAAVLSVELWDDAVELQRHLLGRTVDWFRAGAADLCDLALEGVRETAPGPDRS